MLSLESVAIHSLNMVHASSQLSKRLPLIIASTVGLWDHFTDGCDFEKKEIFWFVDEDAATMGAHVVVVCCMEGEGERERGTVLASYYRVVGLDRYWDALRMTLCESIRFMS